ncbi:MAG: glutaredoxin family protein [Acidimicrobiia bacterium]|nr:glutaredoxin family protein [Acidimicrobiia bacterium]
MRRKRAHPPIRLTVYGRAGCHLCEEAVVLLSRIGRRVKIDLVEVDIDTEDRLVAEYAIRIPVVVDTDTGAVVAEGAVDEAALRATLRTIAQSR